MSLTPTFDPILSRVRLAATALDDPLANGALFERSANGIKWTTVRGGSGVTITGSDTAALDDYEFVPNVVNYYRVTAGSDVFTANITPVQTVDWVKSITRPFLNMPVQIVEHSEISRPARGGVFDVIGRSFPVAVTDVRGSRRWTYTLKAETVSDADALELVFASGDPLFFQIGTDHDIPGGYVVAGDMSRSRFGKLSPRRWFDVQVTEVAAPDPEVVGATATWAALIAEFGTWSAVLAEFGSWSAALDYVADPETVIVP